jgi:hypothetical protein
MWGHAHFLDLEERRLDCRGCGKAPRSVCASLAFRFAGRWNGGQGQSARTGMAVHLSWEEMKRIKARDVFSFLQRELQQALPPDSPLRSHAADLGFSGQRNRAEIDARHRLGVKCLRQNSDVALAFGRIENQLIDMINVGYKGANVALWYAAVEPVLQRGSDTFHDDRYAAILVLIGNVGRLIRQRYSRYEVPLPAILELARTSVSSYAFGFFIGYTVEQISNRLVETKAEVTPEGETGTARVAVVTDGTRGLGEAIHQGIEGGGLQGGGELRRQ